MFCSLGTFDLSSNDAKSMPGGEEETIEVKTVHVHPEFDMVRFLNVQLFGGGESIFDPICQLQSTHL